MFDLSIGAIYSSSGFKKRVYKVDIIPRKANKNILKSKYFLTNQLFNLCKLVIKPLIKKTKVSN